MEQLLGLVGMLADLALVILGFGFIVFVHELGHFIAARWAGIRVLAFALGFGSAAFSYRKGLGWRRGSSEAEYLERVKAGTAGALSPTEYRFNWLPFGGYVKMLGQDDMNPDAVSAAPDSYQSCKPWKRMVVISAGVVMNLILAASLFVGVFMYGLKTEPPKIGAIVPGSPASRARVVSGPAGPGLAPGDIVTAINGRKPNSFNDLILATAMTERGGALRLNLTRPGSGDLVAEVVPEKGPMTGLPEIGVEPARSNRVLSARNAEEERLGAEMLAKRGLPGVQPGMTLERLDGKPVASAAEADAIVRASGGGTLEAVFADDGGKRVRVPIEPQAELQVGSVAVGDKTFAVVQHLLGLTPVLKVSPPSPGGPTARQGLEDDDIFARLGAAEFPGHAQGIAEIRAHKGKPIPVSVLRKGAGGGRTLVRLDPPPKVSREGLIGFERADTAQESAMVSLPPARIVDNAHPGQGAVPSAAAIIKQPGTVIAAIDGRDVANLTDIRAALLEATSGAGSEGADVRVTLIPPRMPGSPEELRDTVVWRLSSEDVAALRGLSWTSKLDSGLFKPEEFVLKAKGPVDALRMGLSETKRVMMSTYITFARLFQGTVKVEHLKGPVGIAHLGTRIAERGTIWLLFFMALISVNLAVINFLPLPVVDGGQFLFLLIEQVRGKPVPAAIQNAATLAGLLLIGTVFVIVTFHDIANLFG